MKTITLFTLFLLVGLIGLTCKKEEINPEEKKSKVTLPDNLAPNTENSFKIGLIIDIDGNIYQSRKIGNQIWMIENLKVTRYRDGYPIDHINNPLTWSINNIGAYCWYNNLIQNKNKYGGLYSWHAVNSSRNLAPEGWHIPTKQEWEELAEFLYGANIAGGKLKEIGYTHWNLPNTKASDSHGFKALPGGGIGVDGVFHHISREAFFWTKTYSNINQVAGYVHLGYNHGELLFSQSGKNYGFSVRCIKDN